MPLVVQASVNVTASSTSPLRVAEPVKLAAVPTNQFTALCNQHAQEISDGMTGVTGHAALHLVETDRAPAPAQSFRRQLVMAISMKEIRSSKGTAT